MSRSFERRAAMPETVTRVKAIRDFFEVPGRPVTMDEIKALSPDERKELAEGVVKITGATLAEAS
jgi:hypothetical protein